MAYQKCPVCGGKGTGYNMAFNQTTQCHVCLGTGIISEVTGRPPYDATPLQSSSTTSTLNLTPEELNNIQGTLTQ